MAIGSLVVLVFGEIVPESYGFDHALTVAPLLAAVERLLHPLLAFFDAVASGVSRLVGGGTPDIEQPYLTD